MSWTTENDPPPPRPPAGTDEGPDLEAQFEDADLDDADLEHPDPDDAIFEAGPNLDADGSPESESDLDEDGSLDPSVFDGLFDDLSDDPDPDQETPLTDDSIEDQADFDDAQIIDREAQHRTSDQETKESESNDGWFSKPGKSADRWTLPAPETASGLEAESRENGNGNGQRTNGNSSTATEPEADALTPKALKEPSFFDSEPTEAPVETRGQHVSIDQAQAGAAAKAPGAISFEDHQSGSAVTPQQTAPTSPTTAPSSAAPVRRTNWVGIVAAIAIGSALGLLGTFLIASLRDSPDSDSGAQTEANQDTDDATTSTESDAADTVVVSPDFSQEQTVNTGDGSQAVSFGASAIQFEPGTSELADQDVVSLDRLAAYLIENTNSAATITVRSYSGETSAANYDLSVAQTATIRKYLTGAGVDNAQFAVIARGSAPFSSNQPVENFVVANPGIGQLALAEKLRPLNPFAIGLDPATSELRADSTAALDQIGETMSAIDTARLTLAAYSYSASGPETNKELATRAADAASKYLQQTHAIDESRISTIAPGITPYKIDENWSNHVQIKVENETKPSFELAVLDHARLAFETNTDLITADGQAFLDQVADIVNSSDAALAVDVFAYSPADRQTNDQLSKAQAQSIRTYLLTQGVPELQIRVKGSGSAPQFASLDQPTVVVLSAVS